MLQVIMEFKTIYPYLPGKAFDVWKPVQTLRPFQGVTP